MKDLIGGLFAVGAYMVFMGILIGLAAGAVVGGIAALVWWLI